MAHIWKLVLMGDCRLKVGSYIRNNESDAVHRVQSFVFNQIIVYLDTSVGKQTQFRSGLHIEKDHFHIIVPHCLFLAVLRLSLRRRNERNDYGPFSE